MSADLLRAAEDELQILRGLKALIAAWVNNPAYDRDARIALAELLGIPAPPTRPGAAMNDYIASCPGKSRFLNRRTARRRASQIRREGGPHFRSYPCRHCGLWHVGNLPGHASHLRTTPHGVVHVQELAQ